jgi:hypothetical protein
VPEIDLGNPSKIDTSEMENFFEAIRMGKWTPAADGRPDWAFRALNEFCRCCGMGFPKKPQGYAGLKSDFSQTTEPLDQFEDDEDEFYDSDIFDVRRPTDFEQLSIFLTRGQLIPLDSSVQDTTGVFSPPHTARVYLIIFLKWQEVATLKTVRKIHKWLVCMKAIPADPPYKDKDSSRNTRTLLKGIGFPLVDKGGAPRKKNPTTVH